MGLLSKLLGGGARRRPTKKGRGGRKPFSIMAVHDAHGAGRHSVNWGVQSLNANVRVFRQWGAAKRFATAKKKSRKGSRLTVHGPGAA